MELLRWWNLIFLLPGVAALLYLVLLATGGVGDGDADGDLDAHADLDLHAGIGADLDHDLAHGIEHVVGEGGHAAGGEPHQPGGMLQLLSLVGVGRIPLSLLLMSFCFLWALLGWLANQVFGAILRVPALFIWPSLAVTLLGSILLTRYLAIGLARVMPATESYGVGRRQLVGRLADARYPISETAGTAQLHDQYGTLQEVPVRVRPGEPPIAAGSRVILWRYDEANETFLVLPGDEIEAAAAADRRAAE
jgi:hypothetical protein